MNKKPNPQHANNSSPESTENVSKRNLGKYATKYWWVQFYAFIFDVKDSWQITWTKLLSFLIVVISCLFFLSVSLPFSIYLPTPGTTKSKFYYLYNDAYPDDSKCKTVIFAFRCEFISMYVRSIITSFFFTQL